MTDYVKSWFLRADEDLLAIKFLLEEGGPANIICFHSQQAGEKYLKGFLAHHDRHTRKIHDLSVLLDECQKIDSSFSQLEADANFLNQFYLETRYPGDIPDFSIEECKKALECVKEASFMMKFQNFERETKKFPRHSRHSVEETSEVSQPKFWDFSGILASFTHS